MGKEGFAFVPRAHQLPAGTEAVAAIGVAGENRAEQTVRTRVERRGVAAGTFAPRLLVHLQLGELQRCTSLLRYPPFDGHPGAFAADCVDPAGKLPCKVGPDGGCIVFLALPSFRGSPVSLGFLWADFSQLEVADLQPDAGF
jgi:hypothetical protein